MYLSIHQPAESKIWYTKGFGLFIFQPEGFGRNYYLLDDLTANEYSSNTQLIE